MTAIGLTALAGGVLLVWAGVTGQSIGAALQAIIRGEGVPALPPTQSSAGQSGLTPEARVGQGAGGGGGGAW